jgi:hypothetical protein
LQWHILIWSFDKRCHLGESRVVNNLTREQ